MDATNYVIKFAYVWRVYCKTVGVPVISFIVVDELPIVHKQVNKHSYKFCYVCVSLNSFLDKHNSTAWLLLMTNINPRYNILSSILSLVDILSSLTRAIELMS